LSRTVTVIGAGPAGCSAAIAARLEGAQLILYEKSKFPRHKVCGEFLSPEIAPLLDRLGVWNTVEETGPARYASLALYFLDSAGEPRNSKTTRFTERPYGLSRFRLDEILLARSVALGAEVHTEQCGVESAGRPVVIAHGRKNMGQRSGDRLFGFKAHFTGPASDSVELYFFRGGYLGVNSIESGLTNVCGLAKEALLGAYDFEIDAFLRSMRVIRNRLEGMQPAMPWMHVAPLVYHGPAEVAGLGIYPAGDALSFIDPFTGTGILTGVWTGWLAGRFAASGLSCEEYLRVCRKSIAPAVMAAKTFRRMVLRGWGGTLVRLMPGRLLVAATRPRVRAAALSGEYLK
jgi:menaquinone-9 beta-reductase